MNATAIINDGMTLEQKLAAIDQAIKNAQEVDTESRKINNSAPLDPASLTICDGCE